MRAFLVIALTLTLPLGLSACSDWDGSFFGDSDAAHEATPAPMAEAAAAAPAPVVTAQAQEASPAPVTSTARANAAPRMSGDRCAKLAKQRAGDAAYQGEDEGTQRSVYDRTYAGCMDWDARHAL